MRSGSVGHHLGRCVELAIVVGVFQQQDVALITPGHVDVAARRHGDDAGILQPGCERLDLKACRNFQPSHLTRTGVHLVRLECVHLRRHVGTVPLLRVCVTYQQSEQCCGQDTAHMALPMRG